MQQFRMLIQRFAGGSMRQLEANVLSSMDFAGFLVVSSLDKAPAVVSVVSNFARYSAGLGALRTLSGRVFGFFGETVDQQMPPLILVPAGANALIDMISSWTRCRFPPASRY
jgi:hypothetical protein